MVADTSLAAYWSELLSGRVSRQQAIVLDDLFINGPGTRAELSDNTGLAINAVCGRVRELLDNGFVKVISTVLDERTNKMVEELDVCDKGRSFNVY